MATRVNVQAFVFTTNPEFNVLILKRVSERSGYWQPVCGGIEPGETPKEAAVREVFEETAIKNIK
jgi:dihydroneopterin triphosphate diphosphatase